jgi:hypothetical protein
VGVVTSPPGDVVELDRAPFQKEKEHEADGAALPDHSCERTVFDARSKA